jgi:hypothetical protein
VSDPATAFKPKFARLSDANTAPLPLPLLPLTQFRPLDCRRWLWTLHGKNVKGGTFGLAPFFFAVAFVEDAGAPRGERRGELGSTVTRVMCHVCESFLLGISVDMWARVSNLARVVCRRRTERPNHGNRVCGEWLAILAAQTESEGW